jgi:hypothetical protein
MGREQGDDGTFVIPSSRTKNKRPHVVPLPALARAIIASVKPVASPVGYVFTISGKSPVGGWSMIKNRLDAAMGTPAPWRLHDLRRTFVTGPADLGIRPDVIEMAVNHASGLRGGVTTTKASCCPSGERRWSAGRRTSKASWPGRQRRWCCTWCKSEGSATYTAKGRCASRGDR